MDSIVSLILVALYAIMFLCTITLGIAHLIMGYIGIIGLLVVFFLAYGILFLLISQWKEYKQELNK